MDEIGKNYDINHRDKIEIQILGVLINSSDDEVGQLVQNHQLKPEDFRIVFHQVAMQCILDCYTRTILPTVVAIMQFRPQQYRVNNSSTFEGHLAFILQHSIASTATLNTDILMLKQYVLMDFWNVQAHDILYGNWNGRDVLQVGDNIVAEYHNMFKRMTEGITTSAEDDYNAEILMKRLRKTEGKRSGVPSTVDCIDDFIGSFSPAELVIIAGRPGMGKTTFALIAAWEASKLGYTIVFFSLEMPKNQLKSKIISLETGIPYKSIKEGNLTDVELREIIKYSDFIDQSPFIIIDKIRTIEDIAEKTAELRRTKNVKMIVIDYLQRCKTRTGGKLREIITDISRECKSIAKDNYIPVIALSQLSRGVESRPGKRPILSDLKESGSIEEDADIVAFLFRQAYYDMQDNKPVPISELFHTEFNIAKGRDIGLKNIHIYLDAINMRIMEYSHIGDYDDWKGSIASVNQGPVMIAPVPTITVPLESKDNKPDGDVPF